MGNKLVIFFEEIHGAKFSQNVERPAATPQQQQQQQQRGDLVALGAVSRRSEGARRSGSGSGSDSGSVLISGGGSKPVKRREDRADDGDGGKD